MLQLISGLPQLLGCGGSSLFLSLVSLDKTKQTTVSGGPPRCDCPGPLEPRVHDQDGAAGTEAPNAHQGKHQALAAPGGVHVLKKVGLF